LLSRWRKAKPAVVKIPEGDRLDREQGWESLREKGDNEKIRLLRGRKTQLNRHALFIVMYRVKVKFSMSTPEGV
jgi:hypothetical protein